MCVVKSLQGYFLFFFVHLYLFLGHFCPLLVVFSWPWFCYFLIPCVMKSTSLIAPSLVVFILLMTYVLFYFLVTFLRLYKW